MSLNQFPESSPKSSSSLLSAALIASLSLALAACHKSETPVSEVKLPVALPTGTMDTIPTGSTQKSRRAALGQIMRRFTEAQDAGKPMEGFTQDPTKPHNWRLASLNIGFGPRQTGTHMVTVKQQGDEISVYDIVDGDSDGNPDFVEYSVSSPFTTAEGTHMTHSDKRYVVDQATNDMYAAGLDKAREVLEARAEISKQGQK